MSTPATTDEGKSIAVFDDKRNLTMGVGRIIWAKAARTASGEHPEGWVLPGGRRTQDNTEALLAVAFINRYAEKHPRFYN